ncbi:competence type IV pilus minor pilin ComGG [Streptococcus porcinus]|uniref:competence type IV pilus minor pilin ComGG n=1 Tax=Streptococcus porcinus TaxID=1340 RepID=UPI001960A1DB|nr:competence type IV pilus minor pilin ComGG [Streptococcus porcinus]
MILKKNLKAGVLLYAIVISTVFICLIQVYLAQIQAFKREHQAQVSNVTAHLIGELTKELAKGSSGELQFEQGGAHYQLEEGKLKVSVSLKSGQSYRFDYLTLQDQAVRSELEGKEKHINKKKTKKAKLATIP